MGPDGRKGLAGNRIKQLTLVKPRKTLSNQKFDYGSANYRPLPGFQFSLGFILLMLALERTDCMPRAYTQRGNGCF